MTQTQSTHPAKLTYYASMADRMERDPIQGTNSTRATVPNGRGFALWQRFNAGQQLVWVDDAEGTPRALTPKQAQILAMALEMIDGTGLTMREMARSLSVAPSTVSRALGKLTAWGLIGYVVGRGRFAGLVIFRRAKDDGYDRLRKAAKARVQRWSEAAQRRISRLAINVASYILEGEREDSYSQWATYIMDTSKDATLTVQRPWTVEELREAGII